MQSAHLLEDEELIHHRLGGQVLSQGRFDRGGRVPLGRRQTGAIESPQLRAEPPRVREAGDPEGRIERQSGVRPEGHELPIERVLFRTREILAARRQLWILAHPLLGRAIREGVEGFLGSANGKRDGQGQQQAEGVHFHAPNLRDPRAAGKAIVGAREARPQTSSLSGTAPPNSRGAAQI
jgi:hypothetical protein